MIRLADTFTGTPGSVSSIISPLPTSFTARSSSVYFKGLIQWNHSRTGGIEPRWTKRPVKVIWNSAASAESRVAMDPLVNSVARRKFYVHAFMLVNEFSWLQLLT